MIHNPSYIYEEYDTIELIAADMRQAKRSKEELRSKRGFNICIFEIYPVTFGMVELSHLFDRGPVSAPSDNHPPIDSSYYE